MEGFALTDHDPTADGEPVLTLQDLISDRQRERGWSYADLEHRSGGKLTKSRWQQLGTGVRIVDFPKPASLIAMADALEVDVTTLLLATACSVGMPVRVRASDFALMLPAGVDQLSERVQTGILTLIRAAVADNLERGGDSRDVGMNLRWAREDAPRRQRGNGVRRVVDPPA